MTNNLIDRNKQEELFESIRKQYNYKLDKDTLKDEKGRLRTKSLFYELSYANPSYARFSIAQDHHAKGYLSFHQLLVDMNDPSEYLPAMVLVGNWDHWLRMKENPTIQAMIDYARAEIEAREYCRAIQMIREIADNGKDKLSFQAAKYLASKEHREYRNDMQRLTNQSKVLGRTAGRPKKDYSEELNMLQKVRKVNVQQDYERITSMLKGKDEV